MSAAVSAPNPRVRLLNALESLGLETMRLGADAALESISSGERTAAEAFCELAEAELRAKNDKARAICVNTAHLPFGKRLEDFDFSFQPSLSREEVMDLKYLRFVETATNILFIGSPGVGKTHLASAIALCAAEQRTATYFITCSDLLMKLKAAQLNGTVKSKIEQYARYGVLVIDEVGFLPIDPDAANLFFQLIAKRYERHPTIITTNKPLNRWAETFGDPVITNAILDRLLHHSKVFKIVGRSYRTKDILGLGAEPLGAGGEKGEKAIASSQANRE